MYSFFISKELQLDQLAQQTGAKLIDKMGNSGEQIICSAGPLEEASAASVSFIDNPKYARYLDSTKASAVFCQERYADRLPRETCALVHAQPYKAYAKALALLFPTAARPSPITSETGISPHAYLDNDVVVEEGVIIEAGAVIGKGAEIGSRSLISVNSIIGSGVKIGRNTVVGAGATVQAAFIGDNVTLHPGVRIGQDGFGFSMGPGGHEKVPQIGRVIIQDHVEIGANTTIDRGSNRDTVIGEGTKIDNLVQIGHNVSIGRHCVIVGLAGVAGSATLGDYVVVAGQVGIGGHTTVGDGAQIGGGAGTHTDIAPGSKVIGYPAMPVKDWVRLNMKLKGLIAKKKTTRSSDGKNESGDE